MKAVRSASRSRRIVVLVSIAAGLVHHQDAGLGAGLHVYRVVADAAGGHDQHIRHLRDQRGIDVKPPRDFVARRADLVDMGAGEDRRGDFVGAFVFEAIEPDVVAGPQDLCVDRIGKVLHIKDALGIHGHGRGPFLSREWVVRRDADVSLYRELSEQKSPYAPKSALHRSGEDRASRHSFPLMVSSDGFAGRTALC
jgi:hypothetical protein